MRLKNKILSTFRHQTLQVHPGIFRPASKPYITGDTFRKNADHIFDETQTLDITKIKNGDIVFLKTDFLEMFFGYYHPKIINRYILITHNSDLEIGESEKKYYDDKLIHWFASNLIVKSDKYLSPLPLGIENRRYLSNGRLRNFNKISKNNKKKKDKVMCSFSKHTNPNIRIELLKNVEKLSYVDTLNSSSQFDYLTNLNSYKFNLCPEGNAVETHRFWESLSLNVVPICQENINNLNYFNIGVPMILVDNWNNIKNYDIEYFLNQYQNIQFSDIQKFSNFQYWWDVINAKKNN